MFNSIKQLLRYNTSKFGYQLLTSFSAEATIKNNLLQRECMQNTHLHAKCGQPTPATHPYLLKPGEVLPGISLQELKKRRTKLIKSVILEMHAKNEQHRQQIVIIPASSIMYMSDKIPYVFRQNTDFLYFSGCREPDCALVLVCKENRSSFTLFIRPRDEHSELWDGPRTSIETAIEMFGMDHALPITEFEQFLSSLIQEDKKSIVWYDLADITQPILHKKLIKLADSQAFISPKMLFHQIRLIKSTCEINLMRQSCQIASDAIIKTIQSSKPEMNEHQLFATVDYECRMHGAEHLAYPPVVAGGRNANVIHYINNNQIIQNGDLVLMDAGCEYHGYASDITRTWPINGKFTPEQRILYEIVLDVQKHLIESLKEMPSLDKVFHYMCILLGKRLQEIGLIPKNINDDKLLAAAYIYCPHHVSHYLGMDVHDTGKISRKMKIQPGMIITIEPGIYVSPKNLLAPSHYHGLGIRIEDDILVTENGPEILTKNCPKEVVDIEALASQNKKY